MKKIILIFVVLLLVGGGFYYYRYYYTYQYQYCDGGVYSITPKQITDASTDYYNAQGVRIGACHAWGGGENCDQARAAAKNCK